MKASRERPKLTLSQLKPNMIVRVEQAITQSGSRGLHHGAIILPQDGIGLAATSLEAVFITKNDDYEKDGEYVPLPWQNGGHRRTGLSVQSFAACHWKAILGDDDTYELRGWVSDSEAAEICAGIERWRQRNS